MTGNNQGNEVEKDQFCKDLLYDVFTLDAVEEIHSHTVFRKQERYLDSPTKMVQFLDSRRRESLLRQVCDEIFRGAIIQLQFDQTKTKLIGAGLIVRRDKIKALLFLKPFK